MYISVDDSETIQLCWRTLLHPTLFNRLPRYVHRTFCWIRFASDQNLTQHFDLSNRCWRVWSFVQQSRIAETEELDHTPIKYDLLATYISIGEVNIYVKNHTKQPSTAKVMKVCKDSDSENSTSHYESGRSLPAGFVQYWSIKIPRLFHDYIYKNS